MSFSFFRLVWHLIEICIAECKNLSSNTIRTNRMTIECWFIDWISEVTIKMIFRWMNDIYVVQLRMERLVLRGYLEDVKNQVTINAPKLDRSCKVHKHITRITFEAEENNGKLVVQTNNTHPYCQDINFGNMTRLHHSTVHRLTVRHWRSWECFGFSWSQLWDQFDSIALFFIDFKCFHS
jgi:hypothetical protein